MTEKTLVRPERDLVDRQIWDRWVSGERQVDIAADLGMSQPAVSQAVSRYRATLPTLNREEELDRTIDLLDQLTHAYYPRAIQGHLGAARLIDRLANTKAKLAGLVQVQVHHEGEIQHAHAWVPGQSVAEVLDQWREQGVISVDGNGDAIQGEITRP